MDKKLKIGYHTDEKTGAKNNICFYGPAKEGAGVDFILCHIDPHKDKTPAENCDLVKENARKIKELGATYIANFEYQNFIYDCSFKDGIDFANQPDGTHRIEINQEYFDALNGENNLDGLMYDELEHCIINRNFSILMESKFKTDAPVFKTDADSFDEQEALLDRQLCDYAKRGKALGAKALSGEHVFPVMFHIFARNGIIPNFKSQKESVSNIQFAIAAGAALQYDMPLWNCVDLWYRMTYPGHSADEMYHNLVFAYLCGVNRVYVESSSRFYDGENITEYGEKFNRFTSEYRNKERDYDISDFTPEIGIVRCDDTFWGQGVLPIPWKGMLFGNPKIKIHKASREYIKVLNLITHGSTGNGGICADRIELRSLKKHRSFVPMNNAAVFDDRVRKDKLKTLKLCFLCGEKISAETLEDVSVLVKEGLIAVTTKKYAPSNIKVKGAYSEVADGKGKWIIVNDFGNKKLKKALASYLGSKDEMVYKFGDKVIRMKITNNGEGFYTV